MSRAIALLVLLFTIATARAQPPTAAQLLDRGLRSYAVGQYADAIAAFREGYQLDPQPRFLYALAQAERKSGDCRAAIDSYRAFLRTTPPAAAAEGAQENLERCRQTLAAAPKPPASAAPTTNAPAIATSRASPHHWARDPAGASLTAIGVALAATGGALWGVGESAVVSANQAARYQDFAMQQAAGETGERERIAGIVTLAVGGAALVAGLARWAWVARHR